MIALKLNAVRYRSTSITISALKNSMHNPGDCQRLFLLKLSRNNLDADRRPMIDGWIIYKQVTLSRAQIKAVVTHRTAS